MRAFLREPSTPWIVFDQEGRPASQLAVGEVLPVALSSIIPDHGFFPATAIVDGASAPAVVEPSSLAVTADLADEPVVDDALDVGSRSHAGPASRTRRLLVGAAGFALVTTLGIGALALRGSSVEPAAASNTLATPARPTLATPSPADVPPLDLDVASLAPRAPAPAIKATPLAVAGAAPVVEESRALPATKTQVKFARLSIVGDARARDVFLDGKRLLGRGNRSFTVTCGAHTIAIGTRADAHDVDVPCNAEYVLGK